MFFLVLEIVRYLSAKSTLKTVDNFALLFNLYESVYLDSRSALKFKKTMPNTHA
jgi:hypothetical protein